MLVAIVLAVAATYEATEVIAMLSPGPASAGRESGVGGRGSGKRVKGALPFFGLS